MDRIEAVKYIAKRGHTLIGGYPIFAITTDGGCLCHQCVKDNYRIIRESQRDNCNDGWEVETIDTNWESTDLHCDNCNQAIEAAYSE